MQWDTQHNALRWIERQLSKVMCETGGIRQYTSDRIADQADQIETIQQTVNQLQTDLKAIKHQLDKVAAKQELIAQYVKDHVPPNGGER